LLLTNILGDARQLAITYGIPYHNFKLLLGYVLDCSVVDLRLKYNSLSDFEYEIYQGFVARLIKHEPLQYITGITGFYGLDFRVDPTVLIPRPETEGLVEWVLSYCNGSESVLDIGTGSGAIAITLKKQLLSLDVCATDISADAIATAKKNAASNKCSIDFFNSDLFPDSKDVYDIIVSNPPYISSVDYLTLAPEILEFEPRNALVADDNGLAYYSRILQMAHDYLSPEGMIFFEIGSEQAKPITGFAHQAGFCKVKVKQDLNGFDRYLMITP
jgi:release factor glutamine methyltransferase